MLAWLKVCQTTTVYESPTLEVLVKNSAIPKCGSTPVLLGDTPAGGDALLTINHWTLTWESVPRTAMWGLTMLLPRIGH